MMSFIFVTKCRFCFGNVGVCLELVVYSRDSGIVCNFVVPLIVFGLLCILSSYISTCNENLNQLKCVVFLRA